MIATTILSLLTQVRNQLVETTARFWSDAELKLIMRNGAIDLWGAILDLHQDHYLKITTESFLRANATEISGVPADCFRIQLIEPADTTEGVSGNSVLFIPRKYKHPDFAVARTYSAQDPTTSECRTVFYQITGEGSPVGPPHILTAPLLSADLRLRIAYNPMLEWSEDAAPELNPVPGGSDNAIKAWTIAYAMAKETGPNGERVPNPGWLSVYATEKQLILVRLTPREEQEPEVVEDLFQGWGG